VCTDIFGNAGGDWVSNLADQADQNGNICLDPLFCDPTNGNFFLQEGSPCLPDFNPTCGLIGAHPQGCSGPSSVPAEESPGQFAYGLANYPNPFNPVTTIRFELPLAGLAKLRVFSLDGRAISTLWDGDLPPGIQEFAWKARGSDGRALPSGTYLLQLEVEGKRETRTTVLLK